MADPVRIDIWSDIACPWCYLGKHRFETALAGIEAHADAPPFDIVWHSYQLSPDLPADFTGRHADYLAAKLGWSSDQVAAADKRLRDLGLQYGLDYDFEANQVANTGRAHQLLHYARAHGRQNEVAELLFKAHFSDGANIGRIEELAAIAAKAGLDGADVTRALTLGDHAAAVAEDREQAARLGINGVPFFVLAGKYGLSGAQEPDTFLKALRQVIAERA